MPDSTAPKHIVFTTFGSFGDLHPYIAIALELQSRGHRATIATCAVYREKIESEDIGFHAVRPDLADLGPNDEVIRRVMDLRRGTEYVMREVIVGRARETYEDVSSILPSADLVVTHTLCFAAHLWIEKNPVPWVSTVLQPATLFSVYDPAVLAPAPGLSILRPLGPLFYRPLYAAIRKEVGRWMEPLRSLRAEIGLPSTDRNPFFEGQYSPECNLALFSELLGARQRDWPGNTVATGFPFYDKLDSVSGMPADLAEFLDRGEPPIVFTLGSTAVMNAGDFYVAGSAAAKRLGRRVVLLVGQDGRNVPPDLPPSTFACAYAPHSELFSRASLVVHQGGIGTTGQALRSGKPEIVVPYGQDQPDNAARVSRLGVGRSIPRAAFSVETAAREIGRVLKDGAYAFRASRIGERIRAENGASTAADEIESMLAA